MSCLNTFTFSSSSSNSLTVDTATRNTLTCESAVHNDMTFDVCAVQTAFFIYSPSGALGVSGVASVRAGFNFVPSGRLGVSGVATTAQGSTWQLIDTFTGTNGVLLNGTPCDTGQTRVVSYGTAQYASNQAYVAPSGPSIINYTLTTKPTQIVVDSWSYGTFQDVYFHYDGNTGGTKGYIIRQYPSLSQIIKRNTGVMTFTTGNVSFAHALPVTITIDLSVTDLVTVTTVSANGSNVLTYSESGMPNQTEKTIALSSNGGLFDNLYAR